ncbi:MAG TPA: oligopeptide/dipeptide ABC transporter ATP-binding protein [Dehalococcoidia bacterium]|nr:oligopeptide/dipeptide ABC transporter ATP-binding protein [Dehalococcoidia bacterium]
MQSKGTGAALSAGDPPLLAIKGLKKHFQRRSIWPRQSHVIRAVDGIDLTLDRGKTLGLVGESGCGKTTTGRMLVLLETPSEGEITLDGVEYAENDDADLRAYRRRIQMVFQDPTSSLDPRMSIRASISEPLDLAGIGSRAERREVVEGLLDKVGLSADVQERRPHQLSGGQRQRVGIARALALSPDIIVADEPTSALDVSIRAQIINLLSDLQDEFGLSFVFISHDLSTVRHISHEVAVMYLGKIVELGPADEVFEHPLHPYTKALLEAVPIPDPELESRRRVTLLTGDLPNPANMPSGCRFHTRCPIATERCRVEEPQLRSYAPGHTAACHYVE